MSKSLFALRIFNGFANVAVNGVNSNRLGEKVPDLPENVWTHLKVCCMMELDKNRTAFAVKVILWKVRSFDEKRI